MTYDKWCAERQIIRDTFDASHPGEYAGVDDVDIIRYREIFERSRFPTIYHAMNDLWGTPIPQPVHPAPLVGRLRLDGSAFADDTGLVLPIWCHAGDLFALWTQDQVRAGQELDSIAQVGYHGLRVWTVLQGPYWAEKGRDVNPTVTPRYWDHWRAFCGACAGRGLRLIVSQGDLLRYAPDWPGREAFMSALADDPNGVSAIVDAGNETWQNGEADPDRLAMVIHAYTTAGGRALYTLTSPAGDGDQVYDRAPADLWDRHVDRSGHWWDKLRHVFNLGYETHRGHPAIQSEPWGPGELVSVTNFKEEIDAEVCVLGAILATLTRQAWVYFSGEGVSIRRGLATEIGFASVPAALAALPQDVMRWTAHHSGDTWAHRRVFRTDEPGVRIDGAQANDGRFVYVAYGPSGLHVLRVERPCDITSTGTGETWTLDAGATVTLNWTRGRVLQGRLR